MPQKESMTVTTLWRGSESKACHSEKEIEAATAQGFAAYNPNDHDYPRNLYKGADSVVVKTAAEEKDKTKDGFARTPGAEYGKSLTPAPVIAAAVAAAATNAIEARLAGLEARVAGLEAILEAIHEAKADDTDKHARKGTKKDPE